ncbi:hypothetical protein QCD61_28220 (plasmid) [Pseudomonas viciae]|uniref:Uncharacterized protein n=1 Tax=Pseudomonas viciae TaxID=2505979 RepID=A0ABY8PMM1_9PSED|nr:hypothetical protein [Pseudomonas viciae]WGO96451.1 hypothetical protein QCD61_28220 [Pseudomonas viciae]
MFTILVFIFVIVALPYLLFGVVLGIIVDTVCTVFQPALLLVAVWIGLIGLFLFPSMEPSDLPFSTLVEVIAQSHLFNIPTPYAIFSIAGCFVVAAFIARQRKPRYE